MAWPRFGALAALPTGLLLVLLSRPALAQQQNLGHKAPGNLGVNAGVQNPPGLYLINDFVAYNARAFVDRNGNRITIPSDLDVVVDRVGVSASLRLDPIATYVGLSIGVPVTNISLKEQAGDVRTSLDEFGFGDLYVEPVRLGWRLPQVDVVAGFGVYIPTGHFEPGGVSSVGLGQWSRELSLGGAVYFDSDHVWRASALSSYISNQTKRGIDIRRGSELQIQGGFGAALHEAILLGIAGYALWQVTDDSGADLPPILRGARDRAFGMGPEIDFSLRSIRSNVILRYEHDIAADSRPFGQFFTLAYSFDAWSP
jgi:hypothetical protein